MNNKYVLNEKFFDVINTDKKAYILGFIYADGYNCVKRNNLTISITEKDREVLDYIVQSLNYTGNIYLKDYINKYKDHRGKFKNSKNQYAVSIVNKYLSQQLYSIGVIPRKSLVLTWPKIFIPKKLISHFIRGYFDGDGCVNLYHNNKEIRIIISTSHMFAKSLSNYIHKHKAGKCRVRKEARGQKISYVFLYGNRNVERFYKFLYKNANFGLNRKWNKFKDFYAKT